MVCEGEDERKTRSTAQHGMGYEKRNDLLELRVIFCAAMLVHSQIAVTRKERGCRRVRSESGCRQCVSVCVKKSVCSSARWRMKC